MPSSLRAQALEHGDIFWQAIQFDEVVYIEELFYLLALVCHIKLPME